MGSLRNEFGEAFDLKELNMKFGHRNVVLFRRLIDYYNITERQFEYWIKQGYIKTHLAHTKNGLNRMICGDSIYVFDLLCTLRQNGFTLARSKHVVEFARDLKKENKCFDLYNMRIFFDKKTNTFHFTTGKILGFFVTKKNRTNKRIFTKTNRDELLEIYVEDGWRY